MKSFHLSQKEIQSCVLFKFELVTEHFTSNITQIPEGTLFFENERWLGLSGCGGVLKFVEKKEEKYLIAFKNRFAFTWRDNDIQVYCPSVYRQLSGKNAGRLFYFSYYESWRHTSNSFEAIKNSMKTEKRWFLPSYINC